MMVNDYNDGSWSMLVIHVYDGHPPNLTTSLVITASLEQLFFMVNASYFLVISDY